jgi:hypothetical protein
MEQLELIAAGVGAERNLAHAAVERFSLGTASHLHACRRERTDHGLEFRGIAELPATAEEAIALARHDRDAKRPLDDPQPQAAVGTGRTLHETDDIDGKFTPGAGIGRFDHHVAKGSDCHRFWDTI